MDELAILIIVDAVVSAVAIALSIMYLKDYNAEEERKANDTKRKERGKK